MGSSAEPPVHIMWLFFYDFPPNLQDGSPAMTIIVKSKTRKKRRNEPQFVVKALRNVTYTTR